MFYVVWTTGWGKIEFKGVVVAENVEEASKKVRMAALPEIRKPKDIVW